MARHLFSAPPSRVPGRPDIAGSLQPLSRTEPAPAPTPDPEPNRPTPPTPKPSGHRIWLLGALAAVMAFGSILAWWSTGSDPGERLEHAKLVIVSGRASPKRAPDGAPERWQKRQITVSIDDSIDTLGPGARQAVETAFGAWLTSGADVPALSFDTTSGTRVSRHPDGKNSVVYAPIDIPGHRNDLAITIAFTDTDTGEILEADLVINSRHHFGVLDTAASGPMRKTRHEGEESDNDQRQPASCGDDRVVKCGNRYDLQSITTHEVGHFLGLGEDDSDTCATMYRATGRCQVNKRVLHSDDRAAMTGLYAAGFPDRPKTGSGCSVATVPADDPTLPAGAVLGLLVVLGATLRRRSRTCSYH